MPVIDSISPCALPWPADAAGDLLLLMHPLVSALAVPAVVAPQVLARLDHYPKEHPVFKSRLYPVSFYHVFHHPNY